MRLIHKCVVALGLVFSALTTPPRPAESADGLPKIGILWIADAERIYPYLQPFKDGLRELGWIDGRTVHLVERYDNGDPTQLPRLAAELVALGINVFYVTDAAVPAAYRENVSRLITSFDETTLATPIARSEALFAIERTAGGDRHLVHRLHGDHRVATSSRRS